MNILIIIMIIAGLIIIASIILQIGFQPKQLMVQKNQLPVNTETQNKPGENNLPIRPPVVEPNNINSHQGTITEISSQSLKLATIFGEKTVNINNETIFKKIFANKYPPIPGQTTGQKTLPDPENISWQDLAKNQEIKAVAYDNISGQPEFLAKEIDLIIKVE